MKKAFFKAMPAVLTAFVLSAFTTSCNDNKKNIGPDDNSMIDFVTLTSAEKGGFTVTVCKGDDAPLATLTFADQKINTDIVKVGQRFLLSYMTESGLAYQSGPATAYAYRPILNAVLTEGTEASTNHWSTYNQEVNMMWRTHNFINVMAVCDYVAAPSKYALVVDKATLDQEIPTAYLLYEPDKGVEGKTSAYYATFDISSVWSQDKYKGLRVIYIDNYSQPRTVSFTKSGSEVIKPS